MAEVVEKIIGSPRMLTPVPLDNLRRKLRVGCFTLEGLNSLSTAYYFNYLFFYLQQHFGFGNRDNLLITALYGFIYMFAARYAGQFAQKHGYFFALRVGFTGMGLTMALGGLAPRILGYTSTTVLAEVGVVVLWTLTMCLTWPTLQSLLSRNQSPGELSETAGVYNMVWACTSATAYLTGGALLAAFGDEILFWLPVGLHLTQLALLPRLKKISAQIIAAEPVAGAKAENLPPLNPRPIAKARTFVLLARIANPFAYVAMYGIIPVIPKLSQHFGLTPAYAGLVCSVWFWARLGAFAWLRHWPGWHYRFRWLLGAFLSLIASFLGMLLSSQLWMLVTAQVVFGLAIGLIYYSSLFYSMDVGELKGKSGGLHEAAIGLGVFIGPTAGVTALHFFPQQANSGTWGIGALLVVGLLMFLVVQYRSKK